MRDQILKLLQPSDDPLWFERFQEMGLETVLPVLIEVAADQSLSTIVRGRAVIALGHFRDARASAILIEALRNDDAVLRARAAKALGQIEDDSPAIVERLGDLLTDADAYARRSAAEALGQLNATAALPGLEDMAENDVAEANRQIAASVIEKMKGNA